MRCFKLGRVFCFCIVWGRWVGWLEGLKRSQTTRRGDKRCFRWMIQEYRYLVWELLRPEDI